VPRVWDQPSPSTTFSFDSFKASLLILFEIVSLEGWTDVMYAATAITKKDSQPQTNASQANAIFFLIYNLLGGVVILTVFVRYEYYDYSQLDCLDMNTCCTVSSLATSAQRLEWLS